MRSRLSMLLFCCLLGGCDNASQQQVKQSPVRVGISTLHFQPLTLSISLPGRTSAVRSAEVRPQVSGVILKRLFREGSEVKAGQQLYQIDPTTYQASYEKARATLVNAENVVNRYKALIRENAVSKQTWDAAVADYAQAKAGVTTAQADLDYTKVRAPVSGRIGRSGVTEGALVSDGQSTALATITQLNPIYVDVTQSSGDLLALRRALGSGQLSKINSHQAAVRLELEDGSQYPHDGRLEFSEVQVDEGTGSVTLRAQFPNAEGILLPGMFVHASIKQGVVTKGIQVTQDAIMHNSKGKPYVWLVGSDNKIRQQQIVTGQMKDGFWQVRAGLQENDRVVVSNLQNLTSGISVTPYEARPDSGQTSQSDISLSMTDASAQ